MKKVLLTGASGYIGQFVIDPLIRAGYEVHAATRIAKCDDRVCWHRADLLEKKEVNDLLSLVRPSHILHLAWYVEHGKFWNAAENWSWLDASFHMARRFAGLGGKRFVMAGTCAEYDWRVNTPFVEFRTAVVPQTPYGLAKAALTDLLRELSAISDFSFASGRIFFPFGEKESPNRLVPSVITSLLRGQEAKTSHGRQVRDFTDVSDVAEALVAILRSDVTGPVNIGSGNGVKILDVVSMIGRVMGKSHLLKIGALPAAPNDPPSIVADVTRLRDEVGFEKKVDLYAAVCAAVEWWKTHLEKEKFMVSRAGGF